MVGGVEHSEDKLDILPRLEGAAAPASIAEAFSLHAQGAPNRLCLRFEDEDWSYRRLLGRVRAFADALGSWGLKPGDRVALFLGNHPDFLAAYLATHLARGVTVPVNKSYRRTELRHIFEDAGVRLCVADREGRPELERVCGDLPSLERVVVCGDDFDTVLEGAGALDAPAPGGDDLAMISYTSGTTGRSKGAMLLHRNLLANVEAIREAWRWTSDDHLLLTLPLFHTHGLTVGAHGTLLTGASAELRRGFDAAEDYEAIPAGWSSWARCRATPSARSSSTRYARSS